MKEDSIKFFAMSHDSSGLLSNDISMPRSHSYYRMRCAERIIPTTNFYLIYRGLKCGDYPIISLPPIDHDSSCDQAIGIREESGHPPIDYDRSLRLLRFLLAIGY